MRNLLFISAVLLFAQGAVADSQMDEYQKWRAKELNSFQNYLDENDKAFIKFLKAQWKPVDVKPAEKRDPKPKPKTFPRAPVVKTQPLATKPAKPTPVTQIPVPVPTKTPVIANKPDTAAKPVVTRPVTKPATSKPPVSKPVVTKPAVTKPIATKPAIKPVVAAKIPLKSKKVKQAKFTFYGNKISIDYPKNFKRVFAGKINSEKIASYWQYLASREHQPTIAQLKATAKRLKLNDWGTAQLFDRFAGTLQKQENSRRLTAWFLLVKGGFDARIAYNNSVHLLIPSKQSLFGVTYFTLSNKRYYAVNLNGKSLKPGKVFTYAGQHGAGSKILDFSQPNEFIAQGKHSKRSLPFKYAGKEYRINIDYPVRYVSYFNSFPQLSLPNYFKAGLPAVTANSLLDQLRPVVAGQSEQEAVNRLLRFVQTAFKYKTDDQQFKEENYLFPLETLHYPYSDCEDRAALFAWLTESLLKLDVIILDYPGHVATAVAFNSKVTGDAWQYSGKRYVVADPTYVNANAGMTMPQFAGKPPKVQQF